MGNNTANVNDPHFYDNLNVYGYRQIRPSLSEKEIKQIYRMFHSFEPKNGEIKSDDVLEKYRDGPDCEQLKR